MAGGKKKMSDKIIDSSFKNLCSRCKKEAELMFNSEKNTGIERIFDYDSFIEKETKLKDMLEGDVYSIFLDDTYTEKKYLDDAKPLAEGDLSTLKAIYQAYADYYSRTHDFDKEQKYADLYGKADDSINNIESQKTKLKLESLYHFSA